MRDLFEEELAVLMKRLKHTCVSLGFLMRDSTQQPRVICNYVNLENLYMFERCADWIMKRHGYFRVRQGSAMGGLRAERVGRSTGSAPG